VSGPGWLNNSFAVVMAAVAVYSAGRLGAARAWSRPTHVDIDISHILMGTAMAGMLASGIDPVPNGVWEVVFAVLASYFVVRCYRFIGEHGVEGEDEDHVHHLSHYLTHLVMAGSMLYMYSAAVPAPAGTSGSGMAMGAATGTTADFVLLPLGFLLVLLASGVWELDGIQRFSSGRRPRDESEMALAAARPRSLIAAPDGSMDRPGTGVGGLRRATDRSGTRWLAPRLEATCHIAMCITMGFMLILML
jgi:hypothetical protein